VRLTSGSELFMSSTKDRLETRSLSFLARDRGAKRKIDS